MSHSSSSLSLNGHAATPSHLKQARATRLSVQRLKQQLTFCRKPEVDLKLHRGLLG
jgi:hypothetical protein